VESLAQTAHQWINSISTSGVPASSQPACGDLSNAAGGCAMSTTASGDLSGSLPSPTVVQVNGASVPTSASYVATNSSKQLVAATTPVTTFSGDGALLTNSNSNGGVTATVGSAAAHKYWGNNTGSSATASFVQPACGDLSNAAGGCSMSTSAGGDLSGTLPSPTVVSTHLSSALPIAQGGTGTTFGPLTTTLFNIGVTRGSNVAPAFTGSNYTVSNFTEGSGTMTMSCASSCTSYSGTFTPATEPTITAGQTYQADLVTTSSTPVDVECNVALGGATSPWVVMPSASNQYRFYLTASTTASPVVTCGWYNNGGSTINLVFSSFSLKRAAYDPNSGANVPLIIDTNSGLSVPLTVYQPPALPGWTYQEYVIAAYAIVVKTANGTDTWEWGSSTYTNTLTFGTTRGTILTQVCFAAGYWDFWGINGSVTPA
jgi:hypothetical protein